MCEVNLITFFGQPKRPTLVAPLLPDQTPGSSWLVQQSRLATNCITSRGSVYSLRVQGEGRALSYRVALLHLPLHLSLGLAMLYLALLAACLEPRTVIYRIASALTTHNGSKILTAAAVET